MVRAAVAGAIDYSRADPRSRQWRIKHRLVLSELQRTDDQKILEYRYQQWCAYVSHGSLKEESFGKAKDIVVKTLRALQGLILPWETEPEEEAKNSTIDKETQRLIDAYRAKQAAREKNVQQ